MTATRIIAYTPNGPSLGPLPTPQDLQVGYPLNDVGALAFSYPPEAPRSNLLGKPLELAVEVSYDQGVTWTEPPSSRFLYLRDGRDPIKTGDAYAVEAAAILKRLEKALVGFAGLNTDGAREFAGQTPGGILATLWDQAKARGALAGLERGWDATVDSSGTPWPELVPQVAYDPGTHLLAVLTALAEMDLVDFRTQGRRVQLYVAQSPTGMAQDRTVGEYPVVLRAGRDLTEAPFRRTWEGLADVALVLGENGVHVERTNAEAIRPWGRQETYGTASGVGDAGTLSSIGDAMLALSERERTEHTFGLDFRTTAHLPFRDYGPGDWVMAAVDGKAPQRMRLHQVTLTRDDDGVAAGNVVLNDRFLEGDSATARRIQRILNGATPAGPGTPGVTPGGNDILAPAPPVGFGGYSTAYVRDDGQIRAQITLNWEDVTTNADGTATSDVDHYEVWQRQAGLGDWVLIGQTGASVWYSSDYEPGSRWDFRVRAVDRAWNRGAFSAPYTVDAARDTTPPPRPAKPVVTSRLGVARIAWNGRTAADGAQPPDYFQTEYHVSLVNNTNQAADLTRVGETRGPGLAVAGPLNYGSTYYAWVVTMDTALNRSQTSETVAFTVAPLVDVSNFPNDAMEVLYARTAHFIDVTADMLQANAVKTMHLDAGAVTAEKLSVYSRMENMLPNGYMEDLNPAGTAPSKWGLWYFDGTASAIGITPTGQAISGARSLRMTAPAGGGWSIGSDNGTWLPVIPGRPMTVRALIRPQQSIPAGKVYHLRFCTSGPGGNPSGFTGTTWQDAALAGPLTAGQTYTVAQTFTVPAGHTLATIMVRSDPMAAATVTDVDGVELTPAVTDADITEIGAGKVKTGTLQATTRIIAGASTGSRVELSGVGLYAYNAAGAETFRIDTAGNVTMRGALTSGSTVTGALIQTGVVGGTEPVVRIGSYANPAAAISQGLLEFWPQAGQPFNPGRLFAQFWTDAGQWAATRMHSPYPGGLADPSSAGYLDVRSRSDGYSQVWMGASQCFINTQTLTVKAHTSYWDTAQWQFSNGGVTQFNLVTPGAASQAFSFRAYNNNTMLDVGLNQGGYGNEVHLKAFYDGYAQGAGVLTLQAQAIRFNPTLSAGGDVTVQQAQQGQTFLGVVGRGGFRFATEKIHAQDWFTDSWKILRAWTVESASDPALKAFVEPIEPGALAAVRSVQVYDYEPNGAQEWLDALAADETTAPPAMRRFRGLMADELQDALPEVVSGEDDALGIDQYALTATLLAAIQELAEEVDRLKAVRPTE